MRMKDYKTAYNILMQICPLNTKSKLHNLLASNPYGEQFAADVQLLLGICLRKLKQFDWAVTTFGAELHVIDCFVTRSGAEKKWYEELKVSCIENADDVLLRVCNRVQLWLCYHEMTGMIGSSDIASLHYFGLLNKD